MLFSTLCRQGPKSYIKAIEFRLDILSVSKRSFVMSRIRSKNTKPELLLRSALFKKGFRYRLHRNDLPGKPDIVFPRHKTVIFIHGCFWHLHKQCRDGRLPKSKLEYWKPKLNNNVKRDALNQKELISKGWKVIIVWECELKTDIELIIKKIQSFL